MNHLAHAHLSFGDPDLLAGNFVADFLRGRSALEELPSAVQFGVQLHRRIDVFTDTHELTAESRKLLHGLQGKYAGVVLDIFYDYLLANNWEVFCDVPLEEFTTTTYQLFKSRAEAFPPSVWNHLESMIRHNWLLGFRSDEGLAYTFQRLAPRLNFESRITHAAEDLLALRAELEPNFLLFYPELIAHSRSFAEGRF